MQGMNFRPPALRIGLVPLLLIGYAPFAESSQLSGMATLTTDYIYRGLTFSDGGPALQLGIDYAHDTGFFIGAWGSSVDLTSPRGQRFVELDYYAGYHVEFESPWTSTFTVLRYTFPDHTGTHSYDYNEYLLGVTWRGRHSLEVAYAPNQYSLDASARHWELRSEWPVENALVISAAVGENDFSNIGSTRYLHWDIGVSARVSRLTIDLRWYDNEIPGGNAARISADSEVVLSVSAAF